MSGPNACHDWGRGRLALVGRGQGYSAQDSPTTKSYWNKHIDSAEVRDPTLEQHCRPHYQLRYLFQMIDFSWGVLDQVGPSSPG